MAIASPYTLLVLVSLFLEFHSCRRTNGSLLQATAGVLGEIGRRFYVKTSTSLRGLENAAKTRQ